MKAKKILAGIAILLFLIAAGLLIFINIFAKKGLPDYNQNISIPGLEKAVTIYRDKYAVPHIYAENEHDLYLATGYVMAQDRMWQMDLIRRVSLGRLSEIFGEKMVKADKLFRTLSIPQKSKLVFDKASAELKGHLNAYAEGVNYYIREHNGNFPLEFNVLGYAPDQWEPTHTLNLIGYMAWDLAGGWDNEIVIDNLTKKLGTALIKEITPGFDKHAPNFPDYVKTELVDKLYKDFVLSKDLVSAAGIPIRPSNDGTRVQPGWTGEHEWQGVVPFDKRPVSYNPAKGFVSSANYNTAGNLPYYINKWGSWQSYAGNI